MSEGLTMRTILVGGAATVSLCLTASALAQDHAGHEMASSPESSAHSMSEGQAEQCEKMGSGMIEHSGMDHNVMDHEPMSGNDAIAGVGSGTARLPANEAMPMGLHLPAGGSGMLMVHGYAWGVYTKQTGPRGDEQLYVQSMAMAEYQNLFDGGRFAARDVMSLEPAMQHRSEERRVGK